MSLGTTNEESRRLLDVGVRMKEFTSPSLSPIYGASDENSGELVGSGTIVQLRGFPYLLTAHHVSAELSTLNASGERKYPSGLCHFVGNGELLMWTGPRWYTWPTPQDVAISPIDTSELAKTPMVPLSAVKFARDTKALDDDLFFVQGFPGFASRLLPLATPSIMSRSQPYVGWLTNETIWDQYESTIHILITHPMSDLIDEREKVAQLLMPRGVSGSLLWKTNYVGSESTWSPDMATVVGLVHRFDQDRQCLIATRVEFVKGVCRHMLIDESAYHRWTDRGRPIGDDWADWFQAERDIITLY